MQRIRLAAGLLFLFMTMSDPPCTNAQGTNSEIRLLVRGDDMGSSHAANVATIETYKKGIVRTAEVMVPGPWFEEAAAMLRENAALDVGVHIVLTSEWDGIKWRPITSSPSLVDKDGYFCPFIWHNPKRPECPALRENDWKIEEIEREFRAQIELAKKKIPQVSHITAHMGCNDLAAPVKALYPKLAKEYGLSVEAEDGSGRLKRVPKLAAFKTMEERVDAFADMLKELQPGTYLHFDHPGMNDPEMKSFDATGSVAADRAEVTKVLTNPKVIEAVQARGIRLMSYAALATENP